MTTATKTIGWHMDFRVPVPDPAARVLTDNQIEQCRSNLAALQALNGVKYVEEGYTQEDIEGALHTATYGC